jgi:uncharacterized membrane protein (Fun14 family)
LFRQFFGNLLKLPKWQKTVLSVSLLLLGGGVAGQTVTRLGPDAAAQTKSEKPPESPDAGMFGTDRSAIPLPSEVEAAPDRRRVASAVESASPWATRVGGSAIVGFVIGWLVRAFIKATLLIGGAFMLVMTGLSYMGIINADLSKVEKEYETRMAWIQDQAWKAGKAGMNMFGSGAGASGSVAGLLGAFMGFRRR